MINEQYVDAIFAWVLKPFLPIIERFQQLGDCRCATNGNVILCSVNGVESILASLLTEYKYHPEDVALVSIHGADIPFWIGDMLLTYRPNGFNPSVRIAHCPDLESLAVDAYRSRNTSRMPD